MSNSRREIGISSSEETAIDLYSMTMDVIKEWLSILLLTIAAGLTAYVVLSNFHPLDYATSATMVVKNMDEENNGGNTGTDVYENLNYGADSASRLKNILGSRELKDTVAKELGLKKYINYTSIQTTDFFLGMKQNRDEILRTNTAIIFEGLKSVMHVAGWGYNNCLAAETSRINDAQVAVLIKMGVKNVIVAFDKDVGMKDIKSSTRLLRKYMNCYAVYDKWGLLKDKDSPCDEGLDVWKSLLERRMRI